MTSSLATLAVWVHDIDPYAVKLWEGGPIRWYGLSYVLGFVIGYALIKRVARVGVSTLKPEHAGDLVVALAIGIVAGGRLGYVLFYQPDLFITFSRSFPFWQTLAINNGGMASHGGMIGLIVASWWYARRHGHSWAYTLDLGAFAAPIGLFFGRVANFVNGELYGRAAPPSLPWAVKFPQEMERWEDPLTRLQPALEQIPPIRGDVVSYLIHQIQNGSVVVTRAVAPLLTPRHPSQIYEALLEGLLLAAVLFAVWAKPRKPLVVGGMFCAVYGAVRIVGEFFRMPDAHIAHQEFAALGVTRGQWLSVLLMLAGVVIATVAARRRVAPVGGWRKAR